MSRAKKKKTRPKANPPSWRVKRTVRLPKKPLVVLIVAVLGIAGLILSLIGRDLVGLGGGGSSSVLRAAIVDQLGATQPNAEFVASTTKLLEDARYDVEYYPPEEVTLDFYRNLPKGGHDLLVLRVHSSALISRGDDPVTSVSLFTNEPYSEDGYYDEQLAGRVGFAYYHEGGPKYYGVTADFIKSSMKGSFDDTTIVMMGCQGLLNDMAAKAFLAKGAASFISWSGLVSAEHTDDATERLLRHLVVENQDTPEAVAATMSEVGPDPAYGSELLFHLPQ